MKYVIGTRGSRLACAQAREVKKKLEETCREDEFELRVIQTKGDRVTDRPLCEIGETGVFAKAIEEALLAGEIHLAVHSMKDLPANPAKGLVVTCACKREDPRDALVLRKGGALCDLPEGAVVGTGSLRRKIQLLRLRPDLNVVGIRGNIETRLAKMEEEKLDGLVLAAAALIRLGLRERIAQYFDTEEMIHAPAQGILAVEARKGDEKLLSVLNKMTDGETAFFAKAEREFLREIGASCHLPVGAACRKQGSEYVLDAMFGDASGARAAYARARGTDPAALAQKAAAEIRRQLAGTVYLVGAGPGDPGLITARGLTLLKTAGCAVYDRLVAPELLAETKAGCELIYAGKEKGRHAMEQEEINRLLLQKSMEHAAVVRLKGGDPYVFGRGSEEALYLAGRGVPFETVCGVSSCIAAPSLAGIPVTHRGISSGFRVVTAHGKDGGITDLDFEAMAKGKETCVFLMGQSRIAEIADGLTRAGMPKDTPAAVISRAAMPDQRTCEADLCHIAKASADAGLSSPAVIVVGPVVSLRTELSGHGRLPLAGRRYLVPKIGEEASPLSALLIRQGAYVKEAQVGSIAWTGRRFTAEELMTADWLVFTSKNGVRAFFKSLSASGLDARSLAGRKIAAVGGRTGEVLLSFGIRADLVPETCCADALACALLKKLDASQSVWHVKARNGERPLREKLEGACRFTEAEVYENVAVPLPMRKEELSFRYDGALFTCASSARRLFGEEGAKQFKGRAYSIGPKTTACLRELGAAQIFEAGRAAYEELAEKVLETDGGRSFR